MQIPSQSGPRPQPSRLRKVVDEVVGLAGQVVGGATAALPGAVVGGLYAAEWKLPKQERHTRELGALLQAGMSVASSAGQQVGAQWLLDIPNQGLTLSNWTSAGVGSAWQYYSGGSGNIASRIYAAVDQSALNEDETTDMVGRGLWHGLVEGVKGGAYEGRMQGLGLVEGVLEGGRDGWKALQGEWDLPAQEAPETSGSLTQKIVAASAGWVGGAVGATLGALDGAVQGGGRGVMGSRHSSPSRHKLQVALAGAVGGAFLLGPMGAACGAVLGHWAGSLTTHHTSLHRALDHSFANNADLGDTQANTYRSTVEGAVVGCLAGARSGLNLGKESAQQAVSQLWERCTNTHTNKENDHANPKNAESNPAPASDEAAARRRR